MNFSMGAYSRGGGLIRGGWAYLRGRLISKISIFLKGRHKRDMIFLTNIIIFCHRKSRFLLFGLWSKEVILYSYCPVGAYLK